MNDELIPFTYEEFYKDTSLSSNVEASWKEFVGLSISIQVKIRECNPLSLTCGGIPDGLSEIRDWKIAGTPITITDYVGTFECGVLYLNKPISIDIGQYITITN